MQIKAFFWKAYSLLSIIASCSPDFHTHPAQDEASDKNTARQRILNTKRLKLSHNRLLLGSHETCQTIGI
jgi:hypothetical protein